MVSTLAIGPVDVANPLVPRASTWARVCMFFLLEVRSPAKLLMGYPPFYRSQRYRELNSILRSQLATLFTAIFAKVRHRFSCQPPDRVFISAIIR